ncbi:DDE superfamily endonuclease [Hirsutella rhossiliensis]
MPSHKGGAVRRAARSPTQSQYGRRLRSSAYRALRLLSDDEDDAIAAYVTWLQRSGFPASKIQVESAALTLLQRQLRTTYLKAVEKSRKVFEANDVSYVEKFFSRLKEIISSYGIGPSEVWNEDECGIRNRESCTLIAAANAVGDTIPPWLAFKTFPCESWAEINAPDDIRFARSDTGFSNSEITFDWIHQFNVWSWKRSARAQRTGKSLEEWFGVDEWCREPEYPFLEAEPRLIPENERIHRLLVIDGFTGHTGLDFIQYCIKFDIIVAVFPPHSTHILQPLDVGVFQPLKHAQQKILHKFIESGGAELHEARFPKGASKKTGIYPPTEQPAMKKLVAEQLKASQAVNPAFASLLPKETRFQQAADTVQDLRTRYHEILSSPTRGRLSNVSQAVTEASLLSSTLAKCYKDRLQRIEKISSRPRRGKAVKAAEGTFYTSVSLEDIRKSRERTLRLEEEKSQRQQLLSMRGIIRRERQQLLDEYRKNKVQLVNGKMKRLTIKQWLDFVGKSEGFLALESSEEVYNRLLRPRDQFTIDTTRTQRTAAEEEAVDRACASARPLQSIQWPHLQRERSIEIIISSEKKPQPEPYETSEPNEPAPDENTQEASLDSTLCTASFDEVDSILGSSPPPGGHAAIVAAGHPNTAHSGVEEASRGSYNTSELLRHRIRIKKVRASTPFNAA